MSQSHFAIINEIMLHYRDDGSGTPIIFANSLGSDLRIWDVVGSTLGQTHRIIRYDKRGHGLSDCPPAPYSIRDHANDLRGLLDHLEIDQAVVVGISVGGQIALDFALEHPERVLGLVLCDTAAKLGSAELWNTRITELRTNGFANINDAILSRWFAPNYSVTNPASYRGHGNMLTRTPLEGYIGTCEALRDFDRVADLAHVQMPTLVLCGAEDGASPPALVSQLADAIPNAQFALIKDAGHLPCVEQPNETAAKIAEFLSSLTSSPQPPASKLQTGMTIRRSVLGNAHVNRAEANKTPFDADFQRFITEFAWGTVWAGEHIDKQTRHMVTIAILAALGKEHETAMHIRATQNTGVTPEQIKDVFHHVAIYAGVPAANTAFGIAKKVYAKLED